ncbi:hypothetical protein [Streptomyces lydicus]|uniref:hypothetical protein n=1 Tax=Streptomyces lydicus TaxID=47763 RepID=UPI0037B2B8E8
MNTKTRRAARGYHAARIGLDALGSATIAAAASVFALLVFHNIRADFIGGLDGRIVYAAVAAVTAAYAADGLFDAFFAGLRERLVDSRRDLLIADVMAARHEHSKALVRGEDADLDLPLLAELDEAVTKAEGRALRADVLPCELS